VITTALTIILRMEPWSVLKIFGIISAAAGAVVMAGFKDFSLDNSKTVGMLLLVGNTSLMSIYYILQKPVLKKYPAITVCGWAYMIGSIEMGLASLYYINVPSAYSIAKQALPALFYAIFLSSIVGYCACTWANQHAPASLVATYNCLQPLTAAVLSYLFLQEVVTLREIIGGLFIMVGLALVTWARTREAKQKELAPEACKEGSQVVSMSVNAEEEKPLLNDSVDVMATSKP